MVRERCSQAADPADRTRPAYAAPTTPLTAARAERSANAPPNAPQTRTNAADKMTEAAIAVVNEMMGAFMRGELSRGCPEHEANM